MDIWWHLEVSKVFKWLRSSSFVKLRVLLKIWANTEKILQREELHKTNWISNVKEDQKKREKRNKTNHEKKTKNCNAKITTVCYHLDCSAWRLKYSHLVWNWTSSWALGLVYLLDRNLPSVTKEAMLYSVSCGSLSTTP